MAHPKETRELLRQKYVYDRLPLEAAAQAAGVPPATARSWKYAAKEQGDDWDKLRAAHLLAGGSLESIGRATLTGFLVQYQSTIEEVSAADRDPFAKAQALASLADSYNKVVAANRKILPETNRLAISLEVLEKQLVFVQTHYPQHMVALVEISEPFAAWVEKEMGR